MVVEQAHDMFKKLDFNNDHVQYREHTNGESCLQAVARPWDKVFWQPCGDLVP